MSIPNKNIIAVGMWAILLLAVLWDEAKATRFIPIVNNYTTTITSGVSDKELSEGLAASAAVGSHVFLNTYDWQGSITGAYVDGENAISGALGKKWKNHPNVFLHIRYSDVQNTTAFGATFKF